jgi:hypothetical protein
MALKMGDDEEGYMRWLKNAGLLTDEEYKKYMAK